MKKSNLTFGELKPFLNLKEEEYAIVFLTNDTEEYIFDSNWVHYNNGICYMLDQDCDEIELEINIDNLKVLKIGVGDNGDCAVYLLDKDGKYLKMVEYLLADVYKDVD